MFEWEENFQPHILERGWKYYKDGNVTDVKKTSDSISAIVRGSEYYKVKFSCAGNEIADASCTCPYALGGEWCKHMAAVLYAVDYANGEPESVIQKESTYELCYSELSPIEEIIESADREDIEKLLISLAEEDSKIEMKIRSALGSTESMDIRQIKWEFDGVFDEYSDRHGYIDYHSAFSFEVDLSTLLKNRVGSLIKNGRYLEAFEASKYVYVRLGNLDIDDDGELTSLSKDCYELWQSIVSNCSKKERKTIKKWFTEHCDDGTVIDYMEDTLQDFLKYELADEKELKNIISDLEKIVEKCKGQTKCDGVFTSYYGFSAEAIELRNIFAKRLGATNKEIEKYMMDHINFKSVRDYFMKKAKDKGDTEEEIRLLKESKKLDKDSEYLVDCYSKRLIEIYKSQNDVNSEKAERRENVIANPVVTIDEFRAYRRMCSKEEWEKDKIKIISSKKSVEKKCELLAEERMFDNLFKHIWEQKDKLSLVNKYGIVLSELYSKEILDFYTDYVSELAQYACNRSRYDELIRYLMRMSQYQGGEKTARRLSAEWIAKYPTRKVMVKELSCW